MSLALTHFLFGATVALWLMTFEADRYDNDGVWWVFLGGVWAMVPDLAHFWPAFDPIHENIVLSSVYALHGVFDVADPADSIYVALIMVALFGITVLLTRYHDLR